MGYNNAQQQDRYFLRRKTRFANKEYYHESGVQDVGAETETAYINWTRYMDEAKGFGTIKAARRMAELIRERYGQQTEVVDRRGEVMA